MQPRTKHAGASEQFEHLEASGADYLLLAASAAVPLYTSGLSIQQPLIGVLFVGLAWLGLLASYVMRKTLPPSKLFRNSGWLYLVAVIVVAFNFNALNTLLPGEGFPWQLAPAAFLCWLIVIGSFVSWSDGAMLFMLVPGVALFGIQSWIETAGYFEISLVLFMASVAVLLTRLHLRVMYANARAAGFEDLRALYAGPWRSMAGPVLAIVSVLFVAGFSWIMAPQIGGAVRTLTGSQEIHFRPTAGGALGILQENVTRTIGNGPASAFNTVVLRVTSEDSPEYLRGSVYTVYRGSGWTEPMGYAMMRQSGMPPESSLSNPRTYDFPELASAGMARPVAAIVESVSRRHAHLYSPGVPARVEYDGPLSISRSEFVTFNDQFYSGRRYYVRANDIQPGPEALRTVESNRERVKQALSARDRIDPQVARLAQSIIDRYDNDFDAVHALIREITVRTKYNLNAEAILGDRDRVAAFLFDTREGYCDLFASALAVMARAGGINARVVSGYLVDEESREGNAYLIRDRHSHMWTEVYFLGVGWVPFDATSYAEAVPGGEVGSMRAVEGENIALVWGAWIAAGVFGLTALALIIGSFLAFIRTRKHVSRSMRKLQALYARFIRMLRKGTNRAKAAAETTLEYANAYRQATGNGQAVHELAEAFDQAFYAQDEPSEEQLDAIRKQLAELAAASRSRNGH